MADPTKAQLAAALTAAAGAFTLTHTRTIQGKGKPMTAGQVYDLAAGQVRAFDALTVDPLMVTAIAQVESALNPSAVRIEPDARRSAGLMQTLVGTAQWLAGDMGFNAYGKPDAIDLQRLMEPQASLYFGAAYLSYLADYDGQARDEEWIVRSYNAGPGEPFPAVTDDYWKRYQAAKAEVR